MLKRRSIDACRHLAGREQVHHRRGARLRHCVRITRAGGFAERAVLPTHAVHALPEGLSLRTAALTEPAACCLSGLEMIRMPKGATVLVIGGGIMGLLTMAIAKQR